jgi:hypothetical protein
MYNNSPDYFGPGYWIAWHLKAYKANTYRKKAEASRSIVIDVSNIPCEKCRKDALEYMRNNQLITSVENKKDELSLFKWTVLFHNFVNKKLGKEIITLEQAIELWNGNNVCLEEDCGGNIKIRGL